MFWHSIWHNSAFLSDIYSDILFDILSGILLEIYSGTLSAILSGGWGPAVPTGLGGSPVEVQRFPLGSGSPLLRSSCAHWTREVSGWGPAVPTDIGRWLLRSSGAHWDRELAGAGSWGPAMPTAIRSWRGGKEEKKKVKEARRVILKSNNPHVAGGEKQKTMFKWNEDQPPNADLGAELLPAWPTHHVCWQCSSGKQMACHWCLWAKIITDSGSSGNLEHGTG